MAGWGRRLRGLARAIDEVSPEVAKEARARGVFARLAAAHREPPRAYHGEPHVDALLGWWARIRSEGPGFGDAASVAWAMGFHDAIYDARRRDNEERSAELARAELEPLIGDGAERVVDLVRLTALHGRGAELEAPDRDAALFLDADLSILGAPAEIYDAYEAAIRDEYGHVPDEAFRAGRGAFLRAMLEAPAIFQTEYFRGQLEEAARANMSRAAARMVTRER